MGMRSGATKGLGTVPPQLIMDVGVHAACVGGLPAPDLRSPVWAQWSVPSESRMMPGTVAALSTCWVSTGLTAQLAQLVGGDVATGAEPLVPLPRGEGAAGVPAEAAVSAAGAVAEACQLPLQVPPFRVG
jgi:hypothetical protein